MVFERFMFNFPKFDDLEHYPELKNDDWRFKEDVSEFTNIPRMYEIIKGIGAPSFMLHTGQKYSVGGAKFEVLACIDDTIHFAKSLNAASLVIRMEISGQVVLWAADASFSITELSDKYGDYLKADILQVPHHGFGCGDATEEVRGYDLIRPEVCLLPVSDVNAYTTICAYRMGTAHLMKSVGVKEMITGEKTRTLTLPYSAPSFAEKELERKILCGRDNCGACTWVFSDLNTACEEDLRFTLLNMSDGRAEVYADLFFEKPSDGVRFVKIEAACGTLRQISLLNEEDANGDALYFNWMSLKDKGIPENARFAVRFISDVPIVVTNKNRAESYRSVNR